MTTSNTTQVTRFSRTLLARFARILAVLALVAVVLGVPVSPWNPASSPTASAQTTGPTYQPATTNTCQAQQGLAILVDLGFGDTPSSLAHIHGTLLRRELLDLIAAYQNTGGFVSIYTYDAQSPSVFTDPAAQRDPENAWEEPTSFTKKSIAEATAIVSSNYPNTGDSKRLGVKQYRNWDAAMQNVIEDQRQGIVYSDVINLSTFGPSENNGDIRNASTDNRPYTRIEDLNAYMADKAVVESYGATVRTIGFGDWYNLNTGIQWRTGDGTQVASSSQTAGLPTSAKDLRVYTSTANAGQFRPLELVFVDLIADGYQDGRFGFHPVSCFTGVVTTSTGSDSWAKSTDSRTMDFTTTNGGVHTLETDKSGFFSTALGINGVAVSATNPLALDAKVTSLPAEGAYYLDDAVCYQNTGTAAAPSWNLLSGITVELVDGQPRVSGTLTSSGDVNCEFRMNTKNTLTLKKVFLVETEVIRNELTKTGSGYNQFTFSYVCTLPTGDPNWDVAPFSGGKVSGNTTATPIAGTDANGGTIAGSTLPVSVTVGGETPIAVPVGSTCTITENATTLPDSTRTNLDGGDIFHAETTWVETGVGTDTEDATARSVTFTVGATDTNQTTVTATNKYATYVANYEVGFKWGTTTGIPTSALPSTIWLKPTCRYILDPTDLPEVDSNPAQLPVYSGTGTDGIPSIEVPTNASSVELNAILTEAMESMPTGVQCAFGLDPTHTSLPAYLEGAGMQWYSQACVKQEDGSYAGAPTDSIVHCGTDDMYLFKAGSYRVTGTLDVHRKTVDMTISHTVTGDSATELNITPGTATLRCVDSTDPSVETLNQQLTFNQVTYEQVTDPDHPEALPTRGDPIPQTIHVAVPLGSSCTITGSTTRANRVITGAMATGETTTFTVPTTQTTAMTKEIASTINRTLVDLQINVVHDFIAMTPSPTNDQKATVRSAPVTVSGTCIVTGDEENPVSFTRTGVREGTPLTVQVPYGATCTGFTVQADAAVLTPLGMRQIGADGNSGKQVVIGDNSNSVQLTAKYESSLNQQPLTVGFSWTYPDPAKIPDAAEADLLGPISSQQVYVAYTCVLPDGRTLQNTSTANRLGQLVVNSADNYATMEIPDVAEGANCTLLLDRPITATRAFSMYASYQRLGIDSAMTYNSNSAQGAYVVNLGNKNNFDSEFTYTNIQMESLPEGVSPVVNINLDMREATQQIALDKEWNVQSPAGVTLDDTVLGAVIKPDATRVAYDIRCERSTDTTTPYVTTKRVKGLSSNRLSASMPVGSTCTVTEAPLTDEDSAPTVATRLESVTTAYQNTQPYATTPVVTAGNSFTLEADDPFVASTPDPNDYSNHSVRVTTTNTVVPKVEDFSVKKKVDGDGVGTVAGARIFPIHYRCTLNGTEIAAGQFDLGRFDHIADPTTHAILDNAAILRNLPLGTQCAVWETSAESADPHTADTDGNLGGDPNYSVWSTHFTSSDTIDGYGDETDCSVGGKCVNDPNQTHGAIYYIDDKTGDNSLVVWNTYIYKQVYLRVEKVLPGDEQINTDKVFKVNYTCKLPDFLPDSEFLETAKTGTIEVSADGTGMAMDATDEANPKPRGIPINYECTFTEVDPLTNKDNASLAPYGVSVDVGWSYESAPGVDGAAAIELTDVTAEDAPIDNVSVKFQIADELGTTDPDTMGTQTLTLTNTYTRTYGTVKATVEAGGNAIDYMNPTNADDPASPSIPISYACVDDKAVSDQMWNGTIDVVPVAGADGGTRTATVDLTNTVPTTATCTFTQGDYRTPLVPQGADFVVTTANPDAADGPDMSGVTADNSGVFTVKFTDTYTQPMTRFAVSKEVAGRTSEVPDGAVFRFIPTCTIANTFAEQASFDGWNDVTADGTIATDNASDGFALTNGGSVSWELPTGSSCSFTEADPRTDNATIAANTVDGQPLLNWDTNAYTMQPAVKTTVTDATGTRDTLTPFDFGTAADLGTGTAGPVVTMPALTAGTTGSHSITVVNTLYRTAVPVRIVKVDTNGSTWLGSLFSIFHIDPTTGDRIEGTADEFITDNMDNADAYQAYLKPGTYSLLELQAPAADTTHATGGVLLPGAWEFTVAAKQVDATSTDPDAPVTGSLDTGDLMITLAPRTENSGLITTDENDADGTWTIQVANTAQGTLPYAGSIGIWWLLGGGLVIIMSGLWFGMSGRGVRRQAIAVAATVAPKHRTCGRHRK
ncbi:MAG: DUF5979 domain-containing protein [Corynebacterium sp.]|nr:DUF5979 domain-containing protein [Corynebacterium sp.]